MNEPGCYFKKIHNQLEAGFNRKYKKYGLTSMQLDVLIYLSRHSGSKRTLTDIAAHFGVRHTSVIHVGRHFLYRTDKKRLYGRRHFRGNSGVPFIHGHRYAFWHRRHLSHIKIPGRRADRKGEKRFLLLFLDGALHRHPCDDPDLCLRRTGEPRHWSKR